jgi:hypothetical protein
MSLDWYPVDEARLSGMVGLTRDERYRQQGQRESHERRQQRTTETSNPGSQRGWSHTLKEKRR